MFFAPLAMREILSTLGPRTREALGALLPGPVTAVVANPEHRYPLACREDPERLGLRLIEGPLAGCGCALFQTSANRTGEPAPSRFEDIDPAILGGVDLAIDGGELVGEPSTVVDLTAIDEGRRVGGAARGRPRPRWKPCGGSSAAPRLVRASSRYEPAVACRPSARPARWFVSIPWSGLWRVRSEPGPRALADGDEVVDLEAHPVHRLVEGLEVPADSLGPAIGVGLAASPGAS